MSKTEPLKYEDVISLIDIKEAIRLKQQTFRVSELAQAIVDAVAADDSQKNWARKGVACEVLSGGAGWRKGKVRICAEFIPDAGRVPRFDNAIALSRRLGVSLKTLAKSMGLDVDDIPDDERERSPSRKNN